MAPEESNLKRKAKGGMYPLHIMVLLLKPHRKTGLTLPELGERDEHGLEPMDHLFSSPEKPSTKASISRKNDTTLSDEEDMELGESSIPEPAEAIAERQRMNARLLPPKAKSPIKTFLQSPARRTATLRPVSSPMRSSIIESRAISKPASVQRKLEFSRHNFDSKKENAITDRPQSQQSKSSSQPLPMRFADGRKKAWASTAEEHSDEDEADDVSFVNGASFDNAGTVYDEVEVSGDESAQVPSQEIQNKTKKVKNARLERPKKLRAKEKRDVPSEATIPVGRESEVESEEIISQVKNSWNVLVDSGPSKRKTMRNKKNGISEESDAEDGPTQKRARYSPNLVSHSNTEESRKTTKVTSPKSRPKTKRSANLEAQSNLAQPGPPLPKSKGLVILRRETGKDNKEIFQTRYGRNSIKPLAFWSNEKVEFEDEEPPTKDLTADFAGRKIKHIIRSEEIRKPTTREKTSSRNSKTRKRKRASGSVSDDEEDDIEPWEADPGRIVAEVRNWDPDDRSGSQAEEREEEIALSSAAIITRDIANASFRFAKTLTLPFFGAGMVDLPPGSEKKQKNSRKMQMAFFVFYGKVQVTVNDNVFRISKGGMWQVPRGNFYGIQNDYDKPARIFFSQGCEIEEATET
ncbi:putative cupin domain-containing protein [Golovinomyces cichoracearum]|uniref:CENP-C homolog n=1 Tax=Golovinomyces cichoracearum TaxID=62708 RepID=A0A420HLY8_9PEZI|nr:putative cupin domain-containing protein [Golovinomyces cichoracearum]